MASEPAPTPVECIPKSLSEEAYITLKKLEYDHAVVRLGLQGTLWGACGALVILALIILAPAFSNAAIVEGWSVVGVVVVFVVPIVLYGSFIFSRALTISAKAGATGVVIDGSTGAIERAQVILPLPPKG